MVAKQRSPSALLLGVKPTVQLKNVKTHCKIYANPTTLEVDEPRDFSLFEKRAVGLSWTQSGAFHDDDESVLTDAADKDLRASCKDVARDYSFTTSNSTTKSKRSVMSKLKNKLRGTSSKSSSSSGQGDSISAKEDGHTPTSTCNVASALRLSDSYSIDSDAKEGDILICAAREYSPQDWSEKAHSDEKQESLDKDTNRGCNAASALRLTDSYSIDGDANEGDILICATREYSPQDWSNQASSDEKRTSLDSDADEGDVASESELYIPQDWSIEVSDDKQESLDKVNGGCIASTNLTSALRLTDSYSIGSEYRPQDWSVKVSDEKQVSLGGEDGVKDEEKEETKVDTDRSFFRFW